MTDDTVSPLALAALALFDEEPRHAYDVYSTMMQRREDMVVKIRPGTLYHAIGKLAESGHLEDIGTDREGNRPERTTYQITDAGRHLLRRSIADRIAVPRKEYPIFPLAISEAAHLPLDDVVVHLTHRATMLRSEIGALRESYRDVIDRGKPAHYFLDLDLLLHLTQSELDWVERTIADLRAGRLNWTVQ